MLRFSYTKGTLSNGVDRFSLTYPCQKLKKNLEKAYLTLVNLRNCTGEERRRQTLCEKRDNNVVWNNFSPNLTFPLNISFCKRPEKLMLSVACVASDPREFVEKVGTRALTFAQ